MKYIILLLLSTTAHAQDMPHNETSTWSVHLGSEKYTVTYLYKTRETMHTSMALLYGNWLHGGDSAVAYGGSYPSTPVACQVTVSDSTGRMLTTFHDSACHGSRAVEFARRVQGKTIRAYGTSPTKFMQAKFGHPFQNDTAYTTCTLNGVTYLVRYIYRNSAATVPLTDPPGPPHFPATVAVFQKDEQIGENIHNAFYVPGGCFEDVPTEWVKIAIVRENELRGLTAPPEYSKIQVWLTNEEYAWVLLRRNELDLKKRKINNP